MNLREPPAATAASVIVYGPQGSGKSKHAAELARFFGLRTVEDDEGADLYRRLLADQFALGRFKARGVLALTHVAPPAELVDDRRILHIRDALRLAGITTHKTLPRTA